MITWRKAIVLTVLASASVGMIAFKFGQSAGLATGFGMAAKQYDFWATAFMHREPDFRVDAVMLVPDGALITMPGCRQDEVASMRLFRRPEADQNNESNITRGPGYWRAHLPTLKTNTQPRGAAVTGCRKKDEAAQSPTDLTESWRLPSNIK